MRKSSDLFYGYLKAQCIVSRARLFKCSFFLMLVGDTCVDAVSHTRVERHTTETEAVEDGNRRSQSFSVNVSEAVVTVASREATMPHTDLKDQYSGTVESRAALVTGVAEPCSGIHIHAQNCQVTAAAVSRAEVLAQFRKHLGHTDSDFWFYAVTATCRRLIFSQCLAEYIQSIQQPCEAERLGYQSIWVLGIQLKQ